MPNLDREIDNKKAVTQNHPPPPKAQSHVGHTTALAIARRARVAEHTMCRTRAHTHVAPGWTNPLVAERNQYHYVTGAYT